MFDGRHGCCENRANGKENRPTNKISTDHCVCVCVCACRAPPPPTLTNENTGTKHMLHCNRNAVLRLLWFISTIRELLCTNCDFFDSMPYHLHNLRADESFQTEKIVMVQNHWHWDVNSCGNIWYRMEKLWWTSRQYRLNRIFFFFCRSINMMFTYAQNYEKFSLWQRNDIKIDARKRQSVARIEGRRQNGKLRLIQILSR